MHSKNFVLAIVCTLLAIVVRFEGHAQERVTERVLIPTIIGGEVPGAHGSLWTTELTMRNSADVPVWVGLDPHQPNCPIICPIWLQPENSTTHLSVGRSLSAGSVWIHMESAFAAQISFNLRVRDLSRQALTWGTEIPVVRQSEFRAGVIDLINVPTDPRFRSTLRAYRLPTSEGLVRVRFFDQSTNSLLAEQTLVIAGGSILQSQPAPRGEILDLTGQYPQLNAADRVRIEIVPTDPGQQLWAFISVTNNETQHVTTITPQ